MCGLDPRLGLVVDRADRQIVLEFLERLLDFGQLHVEAPQFIGIVVRQIDSQQVAAFAAPRPAQPLAIDGEVEHRGGVAMWLLARQRDLDQIARRPQLPLRRPGRAPAGDGCGDSDWPGASGASDYPAAVVARLEFPCVVGLLAPVLDVRAGPNALPGPQETT